MASRSPSPSSSPRPGDGRRHPDLGANTLGGFRAGAVASAVRTPFATGLVGSLVMANALRLLRLARQLNGTMPSGA